MVKVKLEQAQVTLDMSLKELERAMQIDAYIDLNFEA